jgi:GTP-binding protein
MSQFPHVVFLKSVALPGQFPPDTGWEVAMAGRSNSGKSSVINALLNRKGLARTSRTPGRTRLYNYFELQPGRRMVDLPGYGHASVNADTRESWGPLGDELRQRQSFGAMMLVVDIRRGVGELDVGMLNWAAFAPERCHVLLNKADKLPRSKSGVALREAQGALAGRASCQLFSATAGTGFDEARALLLRWLRESKEITPAE